MHRRHFLHTMAGQVIALLAITSATVCHGAEPQAATPEHFVNKEFIFFNESDLTPMTQSWMASIGLPPADQRKEVFLAEITADKKSTTGGAKYRILHQWPNDMGVEEAAPGYLTKSGLALISGHSYPGFPIVKGVKPSTAKPVRHATGANGVLRLLEPSGKVVWQYTKCDYVPVLGPDGSVTGLNSGSECLHHDVNAMDNGHILAIAFKKRSQQEILAKGYDRQKILGSVYDPAKHKTPDFLWVENIYELKPIFGVNSKQECEKNGLPWSAQAPYCTQIVWTLDLFDYFGTDHYNPKVIDINTPAWDAASKEGGLVNNQFHINSISYSEVRNEIVISSLTYNEMMVFTKDAKKELVYRWGQPRNYACEVEDPALCGQVFQSQHDITWVETDSPMQQKLKPRVLLHNNRSGRGISPSQPVTDDPTCSADSFCAAILEVTMPVDAAGRYVREEGKPFGPFPYRGDNQNVKKLYGPFATIFAGGVQRYPNGDLLITKSNTRQLRRVKVTDPAGGDKGVMDTAGAWVWDTGPGLLPYFDQVLDARSDTYKPANCVDMSSSLVPWFVIACPQIFKAQLVLGESENFTNFMRRKLKKN